LFQRRPFLRSTPLVSLIADLHLPEWCFGDELRVTEPISRVTIALPDLCRAELALGAG
jgi:hypothetical protein